MPNFQIMIIYVETVFDLFGMYDLFILFFLFAMLAAEEENLDLVEMSTSKGGKSPVCKLMDYGKMMYQQSKKKKHNKQIQHTKEIKYSARISDHDLRVRHRKVEEFLSKHYIVRYIMELRGREKDKDMVGKSLDKIKENLSEFDEIATWQDPRVSENGKRIEISTTLRAK